MRNKINIVDRQLNMLTDKVEELSNRAFTKEGSMEDLTIQNAKIEDELVYKSEVIHQESFRTSNIIETNVLLRQAVDDIEAAYLKKRQRKLSQNKRKKRSICSPRLK